MEKKPRIHIPRPKCIRCRFVNARAEQMQHPSMTSTLALERLHEKVRDLPISEQHLCDFHQDVVTRSRMEDRRI